MVAGLAAVHNLKMHGGMKWADKHNSMQGLVAACGKRIRCRGDQTLVNGAWPYVTLLLFVPNCLTGSVSTALHLVHFYHWHHWQYSHGIPIQHHAHDSLASALICWLLIFLQSVLVNSACMLCCTVIASATMQCTQ